MAQDANHAGEDKVKPVRVYTAWHPLVVVAIEHTLPPGYYQCISEFQLVREPQRIDVVVVRRLQGPAPEPHLLASVLSELADHTLVHFKGPTDELERDDAFMLLSYALQYMVVAEVDSPAQVALRVVAPRLTRRFTKALATLDCKLSEKETGIHVGKLGVFPLRVVETIPVSARAGEHLLYTVTPQMLTNPGGLPGLSAEEIAVFWALREHVEQLRHPLPDRPRRIMKDQDKVIESVEAAMMSFVARLPPDQVLRAYTPEQVLPALPEEVLRGLSTEYLASLPEATRNAIRARIGRA